MLSEETHTTKPSPNGAVNGNNGSDPNTQLLTDQQTQKISSTRRSGGERGERQTQTQRERKPQNKTTATDGGSGSASAAPSGLPNKNYKGKSYVDADGNTAPNPYYKAPAPRGDRGERSSEGGSSSRQSGSRGGASEGGGRSAAGDWRRGGDGEAEGGARQQREPRGERTAGGGRGREPKEPRVNNREPREGNREKGGRGDSRRSNNSSNNRTTPAFDATPPPTENTPQSSSPPGTTTETRTINHQAQLNNDAAPSPRKIMLKRGDNGVTTTLTAAATAATTSEEAFNKTNDLRLGSASNDDADNGDDIGGESLGLGSRSELNLGDLNLRESGRDDDDALYVPSLGSGALGNFRGGNEESESFVQQGGGGNDGVGGEDATSQEVEDHLQDNRRGNDDGGAAGASRNAHRQAREKREPRAATGDDSSGSSAPPVKALRPIAPPSSTPTPTPPPARHDDFDDEEDEVLAPSATQMLSDISKVEVSITSSTTTNARLPTGTDLSATPDAIKAKAAAEAKAKKSSKKGKGNSLNFDGTSPQFIAAAKNFNRLLRTSLEASDLPACFILLNDPLNYGMMVDAATLEILLKSLVVAAQFDDALRLLKKNCSPDTLDANQTERILSSLPQNLRNSSAFTAADMINALCIVTNFKNGQTARAYFLRIVRGIALEFLEEATSARDRICSAHCERLVRTGQCVVDAQLRRGRRENEIMVNPGHQLGVFIPEIMDSRGIQAGDAVSILPYAGPYPMSAESLDRNMVEATVTNASPLVLRLHDRTNRALQRMLCDPAPGNVYRVDKLANRMGFNRQLEAARIVAAPPENTGSAKKDMQRPSEQLITAITAMDENIDNIMLGAVNGKYNQNSRNVGTTSTAELCAQAVPMNARQDGDDEDNIRALSRLALDKTGQLDGLNSSQRLAVHQAVTNRLTLVQGPPGTGKTAVAIRIMSHWAKISSTPVLATSDSNIAVDNLVEGCAKAGLSVVRLGRPEAIRPELLKYCVDKPSGKDGAPATSMEDGYGGGASGAQVFKEKMKAIKSAQIVCCTCIGSGGEILDGMFFERVLVDEATQATEPATLVPLTRGCRQLVLVGDHCQLPPTVLSTRAEEEGLGVPLFSRMVACGVPPCMLDTQYRMHPAIAQFPSDLFYGGKLNNGVSPPERRPLPGFPWPREEFPVAFLPIPRGVEVDDGVSKMNEAEAAAACDAVHALLEGGCSVSDVAVVTPYAAQVRLIKRMTRQLVSRPPYVEVSSVDGFQGREKEAVIFSAVRSNDHGSVGFVADWRRVNVSFTRARRALIVIGNDVTLRRGDADTWAPWIAWADSQGINMNFPGKPRGRYDAEQLRKVRGGTTAAEMLKDVLERQQAQLKTAEVELKRANKGRNILEEFEGKNSDAMASGLQRGKAKAGVVDEVKLVGNFESNWDDESSDEEVADSGDDDDEEGGWEKAASALGNISSEIKGGAGHALGNANKAVVQEENGLRDAWE